MANSSTDTFSATDEGGFTITSSRRPANSDTGGFTVSSCRAPVKPPPVKIDTIVTAKSVAGSMKRYIPSLRCHNKASNQ